MGRKRHYETAEWWEDWYKPVDYYAKAQGIAKQFCKKHPDADEELVYITASDTATLYEIQPDTRRSFKTVCNVRIRAALLQKKRKEEKEMPKGVKLNDYVREGIIKDAAAGVSRADIASKYSVGKSTVDREIKKASLPDADAPGELSDKIAEARKAGLSCAEIGHKYGISAAKVRGMIANAASAKKRAEAQSLPAAQRRREIIQDMDNGLSAAEIADKYGMELAKTKNIMVGEKAKRKKSANVNVESPEVSESETELSETEPEQPTKVYDPNSSGLIAYNISGSTITADANSTNAVIGFPNPAPLWETITAILADTGIGILGAKTTVIERRSHEDAGKAMVRLRAADGTVYKIKMEEM